jgi:hypothetical protein
MQPPPVPSKDADHLRTLAICHYVIAGLTIVGLAFLFLHYSIMNMVFGNPEIWQNGKNPPPFKPDEFLRFFQWFYVIIGGLMLVGGILTLISGRFIHRRVNRIFSIVIAGLNCLHLPFGTLLGIFTLIVLTKDSVIHLYEQSKSKTLTDFT